MANRGFGRGERGAALIEMAIVTPLLLLLLLGIIEFGYLFGQYNDVRHGAREGARFAAVNGGSEPGISDAASVRTYVCQSMDGLTAGVSELRVGFDLDPDGDGAASERGDRVALTVEATIASLSNAPLISSFLPDDLSSEVEFRMEREPSDWVSSDTSLQVVTC